MTIYIKEKNTVECLDSRETAPIAATQNAFTNISSTNIRPGLFVGVPSELKGLWELHKKYGKLPWNELFAPVIELCREGHDVTEYLARILQIKKREILENESLKEIFVNSNNDVLNVGDKIKRPKLAETLEKISIHGADMFYEGEIGKMIVDDVIKEGGVLSEIDLKNYKVRWLSPLVMNLTESGDKLLYTVPLPGSGSILIFILNVLKGFTLKHDILSYHRIIETFKFAFSIRAELGDPEFSTKVAELERNLTRLDFAELFRKKIDDAKTHEPFYYGNGSALPEDHGTAHISILAPNGDAISITSTINNAFGSMIRSRTGIILNDEINDFTFVKSPGEHSSSDANFISPGKRPISSMMPSIVLDADGHVRMIIGSAGGTKIITATAQAMISRFLMNSTQHLESIFASKRLHHQLKPNIINFEEGFDNNIIEGLRSLNHTIVKELKELIGFGALVGISIENEEIFSAFDPRRGGSRDTF